MKLNFVVSIVKISFHHKDAIGRNKKILIGVDKITKSEIVNQIWHNNDNYKKKDIEYIINSFIRTISNELKNKHDVKIDGLGSFYPYIKKSRIGKSISTGKTEQIPEMTYIRFIPSSKTKS